jgi:hypothetical protein
MSINFDIPRSSIFHSSNNIFTANFNNPEIGKYSFLIPQNTDQPVIELKKNAVYLIERISIGGDIGEEIYFQSLEIVPELILKRSISKERIYPKPLPVLNYADGSEITAWIISNKKNDILTITMNGLLRQTALLNGVLSIKISASLSIYEITNTSFFNRFSGREGDDIGKQVSSGDIDIVDCSKCKRI